MNLRDNFQDSRDYTLFLVSQELEGDLDREERSELKRGLKEHPECLEEKAILHQLHKQVEDVKQKVWAGRNFDDHTQKLNRTIMSKLLAENPGKTRPDTSPLSTLLPVFVATTFVAVYFLSNFLNQPGDLIQPNYWIQTTAPIQVSYANQSSQATTVLGDGQVKPGCVLTTSNRESEIRIGNHLSLRLLKGSRIRILEGPSIKLEVGGVIAKTNQTEETNIITAGGKISLKNAEALIYGSHATLEGIGEELGERVSIAINQIHVKVNKGQVVVSDGKNHKTVKEGQKTVMRTVASPNAKGEKRQTLPQFVLANDHPHIQAARDWYHYRSLSREMLRASQATERLMYKIYLADLELREASLEETIHHLNRKLEDKPYLYLLSKSASRGKLSLVKSQMSLAEVVEVLSRQFGLAYTITPDMVVFGREGDIEKFNHTILPAKPKTPQGIVPLFRAPAKILFQQDTKGLLLSSLPKTVYLQTGTEIYLSRKLAAFEKTHLAQRTSVTVLDDYLKELAKPVGFALQWLRVKGQGNQLFLIERPSTSPLADHRKKLADEVDKLGLQFVGTVQKNGRTLAYINQKLNEKGAVRRQLRPIGSDLGPVRLIKIDGRSPIWGYQGLVFPARPNR